MPVNIFPKLSMSRNFNIRAILVAGSLLFFYWIANIPFIRSLYSNDDKLVHALIFSLVYVGIAWALRCPPFKAALLAVIGGAGVEAHQFFLPGFNASFLDWAADLIGIVFVATIHHVVRTRLAFQAATERNTER